LSGKCKEMEEEEDEQTQTQETPQEDKASEKKIG
jgi:hypothetical protein